MRGAMWKKVMTGRGTKWQHRQAVLTEHNLCFTRLIENTSAEESTWLAKMHKHKNKNHSLRLDADKLYALFDKLDRNHSGSLDLEEATEGLLKMHEAGLIPTAAR